MRKIHAVASIAFASLSSVWLLSGTDALAQAAPAPAAAAPSAAGRDRLFLAFAEDAAFVRQQWWEGQLEFADMDPWDVTAVRGVAAFQPIQKLEVGVRVGFGSTDGPPGVPDGSGATDLDVWGKWNLGTADGKTDFAVGALATVPTGDDTAGLGFDAFHFEVFGALRHHAAGATIAAHLGVRGNGDGQLGLGDLDGKTSAAFGAAILYPASDAVSLVGEISAETERFRQLDSDIRILGGATWTAFDRGLLRGAVAVGITDGAPDVQLIAGYAFTF